MKKNVWLLAAVLLMIFSLSASCAAESIVIATGTETNELEQPIIVGEALQVTVHQPETLETFPGLPVDDRYQYFYLPVTALNISLEQIDLANAVQGKVTYRERFEFEPMLSSLNLGDHPITGKWQIIEHIPGQGENMFTATIYSVDEQGNVAVTWGDWHPETAYYNEVTGEFAMIDGEEKQYFTLVADQGVMGGGKGVNDARSIGIKAESVSALGVLEQETFGLVFQVPDAVADATEDRLILVTINGEEYRFAF